MEEKILALDSAS